MTQPVGNAPADPFTRLKDQARKTEGHLTLGSMLREEYAAITGEKPPSGDDVRDIIHEIHGHRHAALCLSGGGIRSATFNLGLLQALAKRQLLHRFHYLSTVSGGGYIGSWLSSWITREGFTNVCAALGHGRDANQQRPLEPTDNEPEPIRHLRAYSRYLSPRAGLFSVDTWTLAAAYLRNLLLTWVVLLPALAALAAIPLIALSTALFIERSAGKASPWWLIGIVTLGAVLAVQAVQYVHRYRPRPSRAASTQKTATSKEPKRWPFLLFALTPFVSAGICLTTSWLWIAHLDSASLVQLFGLVRWIPSPRFTPQSADPSMRLAFWIPMAYLGSGIHLLGWLVSGRAWKRSWTVLGELVVVLLTGAACGFALAWAAWTALPWSSSSENIEMYLVFALPLFGLLLLIFGDFHLGLISVNPRRSDDAEREWGARFNAWVLIAIAAWVAAASLTILVPYYIDGLDGRWLRWSSLGTYILGAVASWLGFGSKSGSTSGSAGAGVAGAVKSLSPGVALVVATTGFCLLTPIVLAEADLWIIRYLHCGATTCSFHDTLSASPLLVIAMAAALLLWSLLTGLCIDMNKFSLHGLYRMRLIRAYLGASRKETQRHEDSFTGFDVGDNIRMRDLRAQGGLEVDGGSACDDDAPGFLSAEPRPLHVVNVTLNVVRGAQLAWQDRKAESFTISPLHAGNFRLGYRRTSPSTDQRALELALAGPLGRRMSQWNRYWRKSAPKYYGGPCGVSLGTAMAISGAAASPNMGYHSSATVTFLMTLFNARLGWWLGNPADCGEKVYNRRAPRVSLFTLWSELFGLTDDHHRYVYLSDGGHFDNLGLYEMILRRCRFIIVSDASADKDCDLADLGHAIRAIRADMQVPIEFEYKDFKIRKRSTHGKLVDNALYWAKARIRYSAVDAPEGLSDEEAARRYDGTLLYVKPSFYGTEPRDVYNYARQSPTFPHESTADQFFGESQFESYRALGEYIGETVCQQVEVDKLFDTGVSIPAGAVHPTVLKE